MSNTYLTMTTPLPRKAVSILTQIRMGHALLAKHLHHIGKADSPTCPACQQHDKTIEHLILHCPAHHDARQTLHNKVGEENIVIAKLLTMLKTLQALFHFIVMTGHFHSTFEDISCL
jgi:hypothetical protein